VTRRRGWHTGVVAAAKLRVGDALLTRVQYFDVPLDAAVVSLTAAQIAAIDWATPSWATAEGQVLVGIAVWVIESQDRVIVVDPCGAADQFIRTGPEAVGHQEAVFAALTDAGFPRERVDFVVLSHLDGIGMAAAVASDGTWEPAFPNARIVMTNAELAYLSGGAPASGLDALNALLEQGAIDGVDDGHRVTGDVSLEISGGHTPGHALVRVRSGSEQATFLGHLALTPMHISTCDPARMHFDPAPATVAFEALIAESTERGSTLVGPLWPFPGAGQVMDDRVVVPAPQG
jgi:glyoxylase-like metal-dependent hydrolase (beta-lactamase superfamily II)